MKKLVSLLVCFFALLSCYSQNDWKLLGNNKGDFFYKIEGNFLLIRTDFEVNKSQPLQVHSDSLSCYIDLKYSETTKDGNFYVNKYILDRKKDLKTKLDYMLIHPVKGSLIMIQIEPTALDKFHQSLKNK